MISSQYNMNLQLGYAEIVQLVQQLSDSDKAKLVKEIYSPIPQEKEEKDVLQQVKEMAKQTEERSQSALAISSEKNTSMLGKGLGLNIESLNIVSVDDVKNGNYQNKMNKEEVVGKWPGDEPVEKLLNMLSK